MLELSANIEFIFGDRDFVDRIDGVAETGIGAFEFGAWTELDVPEIAERARRFGLKVTNISVDPKVECLNTLVDHADYFIASWQEGIGIVREVDSPAVGLTFDAYHHQVNEGNLISSLTGDIDLVRHIHIADVPGRHEPGSGEINYLNLLTAAKQAGYDGYLGLECVPTKSDVAAALAPIRQIVDQVNRADSQNTGSVVCAQCAAPLTRSLTPAPRSLLPEHRPVALELAGRDTDPSLACDDCRRGRRLILVMNGMVREKGARPDNPLAMMRTSQKALAIAVLMGVFVLNMLARLVFGPLLPEIERDLGLSHATAGGVFLMIACG